MDIQKILDDFNKSEFGKANNHKLYTIANRKSVYRYDEEGKLIKKYKSINEAWIDFKGKSLLPILSTKTNYWGNEYWTYKDPDNFIPNKEEKSAGRSGNKVMVIDLKSEEKYFFKSINQAAINFGFNGKCVAQAMRKFKGIYKNYYFEKVD